MKSIDLSSWGARTIAGYEIAPGKVVRLVDNRDNNGGYYVVEGVATDYPVYLREQLFKSTNLEECKEKLNEFARFYSLKII